MGESFRWSPDSSGIPPEELPDGSIPLLRDLAGSIREGLDVMRHWGPSEYWGLWRMYQEQKNANQIDTVPGIAMND
ncbi:hypothetical protein CBR_g71451, partial [Chara braunii]